MAIALAFAAILACRAPSTADAQEVETRKPGTEAPAFELTTLAGKKMTSADFFGDAKEPNVVVVIFWAHSCPWVHRWNPELEALTQKYSKQPRVKFVVVDSDKNETRDLPAIRKYLDDNKFTFEVHVDANNKAADAFGAKMTPHCFVIGKDRKIVYTGPINDANPFEADDAKVKKIEPKPGEKKPVTPLVDKAIVAALDGKTPDVTVVAPMGCRIKRQ